MTLLFLACIALLYYVHDGYLRLLRLLTFVLRQHPPRLTERTELPSVTILVTAYNEADRIAERIRNLLQLDYPAARCEILIASDGSTDGTDQIVRDFAQPRVRLFRPAERQGKTSTQNEAIRRARGEILVFSDADTRFDPQFLRNAVVFFADPQVGAVDGRLIFEAPADSGVGQSTNRYWRYELAVRDAESQLGILAVMSGACLAIRKALIRPMESHYGEDCVLPLDVVLQGSRVVHAPRALAFDRAEEDAAVAFRNRVRMSLRNWQGTWSRWPLVMPWRHPHYAFALWSHKLLRWLSPVWIIGATVSSGWLTYDTGSAWWGVSAAILGCYVSALGGLLAERRGRRLPVLSTIYSFLIANAAFLVGILQGSLGKRIGAYRGLAVVRQPGTPQSVAPRSAA